MTKEEWIDTLEQRARDAEAVGATALIGSVLRVVLQEVETVDGWPTTRVPPDAMLTLDETAARLNVPKRWLTEHRDLPFLRGLSRGTVRVSEQALERWLATR